MQFVQLEPCGHAPRILVVDDEPAIRRVLSRFLTAKGCEVVEAGNGEEAVAALREQRCDLVLSDVHMSPVDGRRLFELAQTEGVRPAPPFLFVSSVGPPPVAGERTPGAGFVRKPFTLAEVWAAVTAVLNLPE